MVNAMLGAHSWLSSWFVLAARRADGIQFALHLPMALLGTTAVGQAALLANLEGEVALTQDRLLLVDHAFQLQLPLQR